MKIEKIEFEKREVEINETYVDIDGKTKDRKKKIFIPTGMPINNSKQKNDEEKNK